MPTSRKVKEALLRMAPKDLEGTLYDLGSGWGTLVIPLAKRYPQCQVIGVESSPIPYSISYFRKNPNNLRLLREDFFAISLENATMIACYLYPGAMLKLRDKFEEELHTGAWVISHTFAVPDWKPLQTVTVNDLYHTKIYLYQIGKHHG